MPRKISILEKYSTINKIQHVESDGVLWGTSGRTIFRKERKGLWEKYASFPFNFPKDLFIFFRLAARVLRLNKTNIYVNKLGKVFGLRGSKVYAIGPKTTLDFLFEIQSDTVLHGSFAEDEDGWTYFGEYSNNPVREVVNVWRVAPDLSKHEIAYQFPKNSIRHIHGIFQDPYDKKSLWVATGDLDNECFLYKTSNRFESIEKFGDGSQQWRAVKLFFTEKHICWITDSPNMQNHACRMDRETGDIEVGQVIDATGWYGTRTVEGDYLAFTTVEPGPAVVTSKSSILHSKDAFQWEILETFKKDIWTPMKLFKYGVIFCPSGMMSSKELYLSFEALKKFDGKSVLISLDH